RNLVDSQSKVIGMTLRSTLARETTDVMHGVEVHDPFRWLEDSHSADTRAWLSQQQQQFQTYVSSLPHLHGIRERVKELLHGETYSDFWETKDRLFFLRRLANEEQPSICLHCGTVDDVVLIASPQGNPGMLGSLQIVGVSSDGRYLAFGIRISGA